MIWLETIFEDLNTLGALQVEVYVGLTQNKLQCPCLRLHNFFFTGIGIKKNIEYLLLHHLVEPVKLFISVLFRDCIAFTIILMFGEKPGND